MRPDPTFPKYNLSRNAIALIVGVIGMPLLALPLELLQHIAVYIEAAHRPSLKSFSLTTTACHEASLSIIFQRISITVHDRQGLRRDVDVLTEALSRTDSFRRIQKITIKGALKLKAKQIEGHRPRTPWSVKIGLDEILDEEPVSYRGCYAVYDESVMERSSEEDMAWAPMVTLLKAKLPLQDLVYDCQSQFPPSLLTILHERHPQCRLHHLSFKFRTLFWGVPYPYEMELATSPLLYRVKVRCSQRDTDGDDDFNQEAMMELAAGVAPNLTEVVILNLFPGGSGRSRRPRGTFQGLPGSTGVKRGSLKSLSLKGISRLKTPALLQDWARHVDFACLQHLTLGGYFDEQSSGLSGETMEWMAQTQSFPKVRTLEVRLTRDDLFLERPHYSAQAISFFLAFEPLERLHIDGPIDLAILDNVLSHHGPTLRKLHLHPFEERPYSFPNDREPTDIPFQFTKEHIIQIEAQCPILEDLAIAVKRDKSSAIEADIYRSFSGMKHLRSLFLILDCSNWRVTRDPTYHPDYDEEDQKPLHHDKYPGLKRGDLKEAFLNCAIDETLARTIWHTITITRPGQRLERLKLWPTGAGEYGHFRCNLPSTFTDLTEHLARSWLFERSPREDGGFTVRELGRESRRSRNQQAAAYLDHGHDAEIWSVFRDVWPAGDGGGGWRDTWSSTPLE